MAERLLDRLEDCNREFPVAVVLGGAGESVLKRLVNRRAGIQTVYHFDQSQGMLDRATWLQKVKGAFAVTVSCQFCFRERTACNSERWKEMCHWQSPDCLLHLLQEEEGANNGWPQV